MNIFYTSDDNFVPQIAAGICSVCENNKELDVLCFYIGAYNISEGNKIRLLDLASKYKRQLFFVDISNLKDKIGFDFDTLGWKNVVLARLLIDDLLPLEVNKVIYLDGDTIVRGALQELWEIDMEDVVLGASIEPTVNKKRKESLGLKGKSYFNSGVLLINLERWRAEGTGKKILKYYSNKQGRLFAPDQDAINGALEGNIYVLSPKYNAYNIFWYYPYRFLKKLNEPAGYISKEEYQIAKKDPIIVHYLGEERPWRKGTTHKYKKDYFKYLNKTEWKNTELETGWELYFVLYKMFLVILKPFPYIRYKIIDFLIPLFMKIRAKKVKERSKENG
ncbi:MAG: glycosyltransferase family 8 protein [Lachnospiraceae bacterium]|jgi:lipopolysaccharide biosynthesis glycosyltransferase|nr:glycosyltransferase family 8 protein [Lachnospiraceae bacterium]